MRACLVGRLSSDFPSSYDFWMFVRSVLAPAPCRTDTENGRAPCPGAKPKSSFAPHPGRAHPANHCCASPRPPQTPPRSLIPPAHSSRELSHNRRPHSAAATQRLLAPRTRAPRAAATQGRLAPPPILASTQRRRTPPPPSASASPSSPSPPSSSPRASSHVPTPPLSLDAVDPMELASSRPGKVWLRRPSR